MPQKKREANSTFNNTTVSTGVQLQPNEAVVGVYVPAGLGTVLTIQKAPDGSAAYADVYDRFGTVLTAVIDNAAARYVDLTGDFPAGATNVCGKIASNATGTIVFDVKEV